MNCLNFVDGECRLASELCGESVQANARSCNRCGGSLVQNKQTVCLALYHFGVVKKDIPGVQKVKASYAGLLGDNRDKFRIEIGRASKAYQEKLQGVLLGSGVGSQLWRLLEKLGIEHKATCPCLEWACRMNAWGPRGCQLARLEIIDHMRLSAKHYGWVDIGKAVGKVVSSGIVWRLSILDPYGSLLDEAINLAIQATAESSSPRA